MNIAPKCKFGIYYDDIDQIFFIKSDNKEHHLSKLPNNGSDLDNNLLQINDLSVILNPKKILEILEQKLHNNGMTSKDFRYKEIFKVFLMKYYDESYTKKNTYLEFQKKNNEALDDLKIRMDLLYSKAYKYYATNTPITIEEKLQMSKTDIKSCLDVLEGVSFIKTNQQILQDFFMYFAPQFLKKDLDQYYTPQEIVDFMVSSIELDNTKTIIDPCGGSADFLVGFLKKGILEETLNTKENIHYWDISKDASNVATLNMILNGDGRSQINVMDSIEKYDYKNNSFSICITNPPFGVKTLWNKELTIMKSYELGKKDNTPFAQQLGILFIERCINLLKEDGILTIILPAGYFNNPSDFYIRDFLLKTGKIIAIINLPDNVFKKSGAGGNTSILIFKKTNTIQDDYEIFTAIANKVGFDHTSKTGDKIYLRDNRGNYILDENNNKVISNDLIDILKKLKYFCHRYDIDGMEKSSSKENYNYTTKNNILMQDNLVINAKVYSDIYLNVIEKIKNSSFTSLKKLNADVSNKKDFNKKMEDQYYYLETSDLFNGIYKKGGLLHGWELPDRAKLNVARNDILISKLNGSLDKFCIITEDTFNLVATNGFYRVRIEDEKQRLNFFAFLFTKEYKVQMEALSTGTIMADVKYDDLLNSLYIPTDNIEENYITTKGLVSALEKLF